MIEFCFVLTVTWICLFQLGTTDELPFLLETRFGDLGATFTQADAWGVHAVRAGRIITGQNPASSEEAALLMVSTMQVITK